MVYGAGVADKQPATPHEHWTPGMPKSKKTPEPAPMCPLFRSNKSAYMTTETCLSRLFKLSRMLVLSIT